MDVINRRVTASIDGDFVVLLIGARINRWWKLYKYLWFPRSMKKMVAELEEHPESGFLGYEQLSMTTLVQYWRSQDALVAYARSREGLHYPFWVKFFKEIGSSGDIGVWHETFIIRAGDYECVYNNVPLRGLAKASRHVDAVGRLETAYGRVGRSDGTDAPIDLQGNERGQK